MFLTLGMHGSPKSLIMSLCGFPAKLAIGYDPLGAFASFYGSRLSLSEEGSRFCTHSVGHLALFKAMWLCESLLTIPCFSIFICELKLAAIFYLKFLSEQIHKPSGEQLRSKSQLENKSQNDPSTEQLNLIRTRTFCCVTYSQSFHFHLYLCLHGSCIMDWLYFIIIYLNLVFLLIRSSIWSIV